MIPWGIFTPLLRVWKQYLCIFSLFVSAISFLWKRLVARLMVWKRRHANVWGISKSCKEINLSFFADKWSLVFERVELALKKMTIGLPQKIHSRQRSRRVYRSRRKYEMINITLLLALRPFFALKNWRSRSLKWQSGSENLFKKTIYTVAFLTT